MIVSKLERNIKKYNRLTFFKSYIIRQIVIMNSFILLVNMNFDIIFKKNRR